MYMIFCQTASQRRTTGHVVISKAKNGVVIVGGGVVCTKVSPVRITNRNVLGQAAREGSNTCALRIGRRRIIFRSADSVETVEHPEEGLDFYGIVTDGESVRPAPETPEPDFDSSADIGQCSEEDESRTIKRLE